MNIESEVNLLKIELQKLQKQNEYLQKQNENLQKQKENLQTEFEILQKEIQQIKGNIEYLTEKRKEQYYQRYLEKLFSATHKKTKHGITDITTDTQIIEIKHWKAYKSALGQLISYKQSDSEKLLEVYFFGTYNKNKDSIIELFKQNNISVYELVDTPTGIQTNEVYKVCRENDLDKFVELYLEKKPGDGVNWIKLWNYYQSWYEEEYGGNISVKKSIVKKYFEDRIFKSKAIPVSKDIGRGWCGWRIKE